MSGQRLAALRDQRVLRARPSAAARLEKEKAMEMQRLQEENAALRTAGAEALTTVTAAMAMLDDALAELRRDPRQTRGGHAVGHMGAAMEQARGTLAGLDALASAVTGHRAGEDGA
jgi:hypothetical protein